MCVHKLSVYCIEKEKGIRLLDSGCMDGWGKKLEREVAIYAMYAMLYMYVIYVMYVCSNLITDKSTDFLSSIDLLIYAVSDDINQHFCVINK